MVQKMAPLFEGLSGSFSGSVKVDTPLDEQMNPILQALNGEGSLSTKSLSLSNVAFIDQVADILKKPELKNLSARDLKIDFTIKDGRVNTKPFDIKMGDYTMNLSGSTGLDQTIDYRGKITIPESAGLAAKLGTVDMTIGGTFTSPKVGIDLESLAKQAVSQVTDKVKEQAEQKLEEVKQEAQQKVDEVKQQAQQKVDEVKQQAKEKAEEAAKDAVSKLLGSSKSEGEAADSTAQQQQQQTVETVKSVLNLFKKKN